MRIARYLILTVLGLILSAPVSAQWKLAASNVIAPIFRPYNGGGVIINHNGILWAGYQDIWMSKDLGKTWTKRAPAYNPPSFMNSCIKDIDFFDDNNGLFTTQNGEVLITHDQGLTWKLSIPPNGPSPSQPSIESACFAGSPQNIIACSYLADIYVSGDGGVSWSTVRLDSFATKVVAGNGGTAYITSGINRLARLWITTDAGKTWSTQGGTFNWDSFSFARDQCDTSTFYVANDDFVEKTDGNSRIYVSNNTGTSWMESDVQLHPHHCGSITAAPNAIFAQTFSGISRSTDHGQTWKNIGGPSNIEDTRFVTALSNNTIVAVDNQGSVWVTDNSGGDSVILFDPTPLALETGDQKTDTIGGTVMVPISLNGMISSEDVELTMHYDPELQYLGTYSKAGVRLDLPGQSWPGRSNLQIIGANSSGILGESYFNVFSDSSKDLRVSFDSLRILSAILPCGSSIGQSVSAGITPATSCISNILTHFVRDSTVPQLRIFPNPGTGSITITSNTDLGWSQISVYDILGKKWGNALEVIAPNQVTFLDLYLPSGLYYVNIRTSTNSFTLHALLQH